MPPSRGNELLRFILRQSLLCHMIATGEKEINDKMGEKPEKNGSLGWSRTRLREIGMPDSGSTNLVGACLSRESHVIVPLTLAIGI
jgi:hypothetical protein